MGLFDLAAPLLTLVHTALAPWMHSAVEIALWALLCAWVSMWLYSLFSNQEQLAELKVNVRLATHELAAYNGDFSGMLSKVEQALRLTFRQVALTMVPALLASLPVLLVLTWLSNTFEHELPRIGQLQTVKAPAEKSNDLELIWSPPGAATQIAAEMWVFQWPDVSTPITMKDRNGTIVVTFPLRTPIPILHKRGVWNWLVGNPAGYLPEQAVIDVLEIPLPEKEILHFGPAWLRGWMAPFLLVLVVFSMGLKRRWRLL